MLLTVRWRNSAILLIAIRTPQKYYLRWCSCNSAPSSKCQRGSDALMRVFYEFMFLLPTAIDATTQ